MAGGEGDVAAFPTPDELWSRTFAAQNAWRDRFAAIPFETRGRRVGRSLLPGHRHRQRPRGRRRREEAGPPRRWRPARARPASRRRSPGSCSAVAGTCRGEPTRQPRILFLADRNILADQAYNEFSFFPEDALVRITPADIRKKGKVPKNGSIFFTIFQTFLSGENDTPYFGDYPADFFDFVIVDECHRGGANDESTWRAILEHFAPAVQLGMTATPKRTDNVDTYKYFGEPVYTYSLKEGINDGYLTPFKVRQIATTIDEYVYTSDDYVVEGEVEAGKVYEERDFNRIIEIKAREAYRVRLVHGDDRPAREDHRLLRHAAPRPGRP